ncbi:MAG TPA: protein kinase [Kofleriaceae bacterium]|nr:protein kinase [Kofleriaceae bacterium]
MTCPSCNSPLEPNARFCGVCGYRLAPNRAAGRPAGVAIVDAPRAAPQAAPQAAERAPHAPPLQSLAPTTLPLASKPGLQLPPQSSRPALQPPQSGRPALQPPTQTPADGAAGGAAKAAASPASQKPQPRAPAKSRPKSGDEIYLNQVLNNRFRVESKIGEGGFGAVYRGVQLATGRKVALKLLHPEMTKDENLVARFRREGMVLCNLRDAHTITTYDFDRTPDGTLYIAMELLEGKSLHQIFHEEAPLDWKRVFKILTEMCSSLAEAHTQGIVHRDLKPENIYLESRSGNPEFVKILDFGIAKVMRGDTIDPQSPQLTATGQTLGTLEYMSPEQLMGKPLDGRSDVYALGVLAYEMITGRLPFPDAKGPAGLITAQLKHTPVAPSQANPKAQLPRAADRAILKCLEKDKNNRYPDVSALAAALQEVMTSQSSELAALQQMQIPAGQNRGPQGAELLETRRGELPNVGPPAMPPMASISPMSGTPDAASGLAQSPVRGPQLPPVMTPPVGSPMFAPHAMPSTPVPGSHPAPYPPAPSVGPPPPGMHGAPPASMPMGMGSYPQAAHYPRAGVRRGSSTRIVWWLIALLVLGAGAGAAIALLVSKYG